MKKNGQEYVEQQQIHKMAFVKQPLHFHKSNLSSGSADKDNKKLQILFPSGWAV